METETEEPGPKREKETSHILFDGRNFFLSSWVRHYIQNHYELDRWLLGYCVNFLLPIGVFLWAIFFVSVVM